MAIVRIPGGEIDVDVRDELMQYDWYKPRWTDEKLIACSPFRPDETPSFAVTLEGDYAGAFVDSGAIDEHKSGNFAELLSFLRDEDYGETVEYLFEMYGYKPIVDETERITVKPVKIRKTRRDNTLDKSIVSVKPTKYLRGRGIPDKVQRFMNTGYDAKDKAVTLPWMTADGELVNVKYRSTSGKKFWYAKGGRPINTLVYGIDQVYRHELSEVVMCEAEIDALSWYACGVPAVAIGGSYASKVQLDLIRKSPICKVILAPDNDDVGNELTKSIKDRLMGYVQVDSVRIPSPYKDANEALQGGLDLGTLISS